jgi:DNA repair protein RecO (recombination protein O)
VNAPSTLQRTDLREAEPGYVLHSYSFKETSLVVEVFTRDCGRLGLVAKGARRPRSALRGTLMAFQPLLLSWSGRSELRVLRTAEWAGGQSQLSGLALICGFYLNELVLKLTQRDDPHTGTYAGYEDALAALRVANSPAAVLRRFECRMLADLGYGLTLTQDADGAAIDAAASYTYVPERGAVVCGTARAQAQESDLQIAGKTLLDMARDDYSDPATVQQSRALMRRIINHHLAGQVLHTRQLLRDMQFS